MRIYTRAGDKGDTGLLGGLRVPKDDPRVVVCGELDELNATLGLACALCQDAALRDVLTGLQSRLLDLGAEIASLGSTKRECSPITTTDVTQVEVVIDRLSDHLPPLTRFVLPGGTPCSAAVHIARAVCRRAERSLVALDRLFPVSPDAMAFLNRVSDLLFVIARVANACEGVEDQLWAQRERGTRDE